MKDRRTSERRETFEYWTVTEAETGKRIGMVVDLNREGLRLHCDAPVKAGTQLICAIHLDKRIAGVDTIELVLKCRWCRKVKTSHLSACGFELVEQSKAYMKVEQRLIDFFSIAV
ncbi:MAG: PilZ domain-containing protein [bacterium]